MREGITKRGRNGWRDGEREEGYFKGREGGRGGREVITKGGREVGEGGREGDRRRLLQRERGRKGGREGITRVV